MGLLPYALSSAVAIVPWSITFVYFGSMAKNMADILEGRAGPHGASSVALLALSGIMLVAVVVYSTIIARSGTHPLRLERPLALACLHEEALTHS